tara:strand:- start:353 stop:1258 length:906 start_codon:yes stop_codon:yes gene_type:complete
MLDNTTVTVSESKEMQAARELLAELLKNPPKGSITLTITPDLAEIMLERNPHNRPVTDSHVLNLQRQIAEGKWLHTGEPIIFDVEGNLINGQHRLWACFNGEVSFITDVRFGRPSKAFAFVDIGRKRTAGDIFSINGVSLGGKMATATRWAMRYYDESLLSKGKLSTGRITEDELYRWFKSHPKMGESMHVYRAFVGTKLASPPMMMAVHYICNRAAGREAADIFFHRLSSGLDMGGRDDPCHVLRQRLITNIGAKDKLGSQMIFIFTLKAWNAWREKRTIRVLRFRTNQNPDEKFPKASK